MSRSTADRQAAARALLRFLERPGRLDRWLEEESQGLNSDQRRRARALLYAALRNDALIGLHLAPFLPQPLERQRAAPRAALILGTTELLFMNSVPDRAAVDQAVELCRVLGGGGQAGFVNAVLRRVIRSGGPSLPDRETDPLGWAEKACSHPRWLVELMAEGAEPSEVADWCEANQVEPSTVLAVPNPEHRAQLLAELDASPGLLSPCALRLPRGAGRIEKLRGFNEGWFWVQDEAAQLAVALLGARPGERVLDACAAPGGKTLALAHAVGCEGSVLATDRDRKRLRLVDESVARVGATCVEVQQRDWIREPFGAREDDIPFDRVLIDAPCSGLGVIRRHPEIRSARRQTDLPRYAQRQGELLTGLAAATKPGGLLVYAVCTFSATETHEVVGAALAHESLTGFELESVQESLPELPNASIRGGAIRTLPHQSGSDGFYAVALRRRF